jgi:hypothetical protein
MPTGYRLVMGPRNDLDVVDSKFSVEMVSTEQNKTTRVSAQRVISPATSGVLIFKNWLNLISVNV